MLPNLDILFCYDARDGGNSTDGLFDLQKELEKEISDAMAGLDERLSRLETSVGKQLRHFEGIYGKLEDIRQRALQENPLYFGPRVDLAPNA